MTSSTRLRLQQCPCRIHPRSPGDCAVRPNHRGGLSPGLTAPILPNAYNPRRRAVFSAQAARIRKTLGECEVTTDHAAGTAIPDLAAKPIIDIDLIVSDPPRRRPGARSCMRLGCRRRGAPDTDRRCRRVVVGRCQLKFAALPGAGSGSLGRGNPRSPGLPIARNVWLYRLRDIVS
ncbi:GrpB family protein [Nocardia takedensis]|uniref:GrpB family protein n=1 Tax=Nocardia takedensis TaxID=259390 RepID=UPI003F75A4E4